MYVTDNVLGSGGRAAGVVRVRGVVSHLSHRRIGSVQDAVFAGKFVAMVVAPSAGGTREKRVSARVDSCGAIGFGRGIRRIRASALWSAIDLCLG